MTLALAPNVHLAVLGEDVILLDVTADAYACVPAGVALLRPDAGRRHVAPVDPEIGRALLESGYVEGDGSNAGHPSDRRPAVGLPPRPAADLASEEPLTPGIADLVRLLLAYADYLAIYRRRDFADVLSWASERMPKAPRDALEVLRLAVIFDRWAVWLPMPGKCLVRSFVLLRYLQRSGCAAVWVFGVRTWPFSAHCWLQHQDVVLDDLADRLIPYEPILALG